MNMKEPSLIAESSDGKVKTRIQAEVIEVNYGESARLLVKKTYACTTAIPQPNHKLLK